jgi:3,4-dihydroxy 2-butanone 4-phosphate synthase/GTP cyclohydrolase II
MQTVTNVKADAPGALHDYITSAKEIIAEARAGRIFILVDDEDRENEGDLIIPAQFATPDIINFMAKHARGLICLAMTRQRCEELGLPLMSKANGSAHETAFTVSIEAREGVTTGISAADRARTVAVAINPELKCDDIVTPGHVFPLLARDGGTLIRSEKLVKRIEQQMLPGPDGSLWRMIVYRNLADQVEHLALVKGDIQTSEPVLVRMHALDTIRDIPGSAHPEGLRKAMHIIAKANRGVVVLIRESRPDAVSTRIRALADGVRVEPTLRDYGIGAQMLTELGIKEMILLSNRIRNMVGMEGYGLKIVEHRKLDAP